MIYSNVFKKGIRFFNFIFFIFYFFWKACKYFLKDQTAVAHLNSHLSRNSGYIWY